MVMMMMVMGVVMVVVDDHAVMMLMFGAGDGAFLFFYGRYFLHIYLMLCWKLVMHRLT